MIFSGDIMHLKPRNVTVLFYDGAFCDMRVVRLAWRKSSVGKIFPTMQYVRRARRTLSR